MSDPRSRLTEPLLSSINEDEYVFIETQEELRKFCDSSADENFLENSVENEDDSSPDCGWVVMLPYISQDLKEKDNEQYEEELYDIPEYFYALSYPWKSTTYDISFYVNTTFNSNETEQVRVNFSSKELFWNGTINALKFAFSLFCNTPGILYATGAITGTLPKDIPEKLVTWSPTMKALSLSVGSCYAIVHVPLIANSLQDVPKAGKHLAKTFYKHPLRNSAIAGLSLHAAGGYALVGYKSLYKISKPLASMNAMASFSVVLTLRTKSIFETCQEYENGELKAHWGMIPASVLGVGALVPFIQKTAEAYLFVGVDYRNWSKWISIPAFIGLSAAHFATFAYQAFRLPDTLKKAKDCFFMPCQDSQPRNLDSTSFLIQHLTSTKTRTRLKQFSLAANLVLAPFASLSIGNLSSDSIRAEDSLYEGIVPSDKGLFSPGDPVTKAFESIAIAGATATYGNLSTKAKMRNYLLAAPENKTSHQIQGDPDRKIEMKN